MADVIFEKEDRVKVSSGKLKGNKGYVRFVGTVESKEDTIYVGVELDEPNGKHDGKVKGKRYFKCRDKHGYMAPFDVFELFGKSKKKLSLKSSKSSSRTSSKTSSKATSPALRNAKSSKSMLDRRRSSKLSSKSSVSVLEKKKKKKRKKVSTITDDPEDVVNAKNNITDDPMDLLLNPTDIMGIAASKSPSPIITQITYKDASVQTDMKLSVVNDDNDIASVSKEVAEAHASMIQSLRGQINKLNLEITELKTKNLKLENEMLTKNDLIEMMTIEKEAMTEEIETLKENMEEKEIMIENLELDLEDLKDERDEIRSEYVLELESGQQDIASILDQNRVLKETMDILKKTALQQVNDKNTEILNLSLKCKRIPSLENHIDSLEKELKFKQDIENELNEFKLEIDLRADSDKMIEVLSTKNVELEYEVKRLNEVNKHLEEMENLFHEIEAENEQYIFDLNEEIKNKDITLSTNIKKCDKATKELRHAQNTVFQFKDHIRKLEDTKRKMSLRENNFVSTKKEQQLEKEMLLRSNLELLDRLNLIKGELINYSKIAAKGFSHSVENMILQKHIPKQIKCDYGAMEFLGFLQRISFKVRFCKEILDSFYIADESSIGGDIAGGATNDLSGSDDIKDTYKVLELCPILVKQDRFIEAIQRALIASYVDKFNDAVNHWAVLIDVEEKYDRLLKSVEDNDIRGMIAITDIFCCNDTYRSFIIKNYADFNTEMKYRGKEKIDKWALYEVIQQLKYNLYTMQLKTREMNDIVAKLNTDNTDIGGDGLMMNGSFNPTDEDDRKLMNGSFNPTDDYQEDEVDGAIKTTHRRPQKRQLLLGVLQKMEEFQSLLTQIVRRTLRYCSPTRCVLFGKRSDLNKLRDENYIGIEFDFIERTAQMMRTLTVKTNLLVDALQNVDTELSHFDRVGKINRLLDEQSESSSNGLVPNLELLYKHLKGLPYALEQLFTSNNISSVDESELNAIALGQISMDKLYFMHLELEDELKTIKNKNAASLIRTAAREEEEEETDIRGYKKKQCPWFEKAKVIREELEEADIVRDALESAQAEIKYKHKELLLEKSNTQQIKSRLDVVKLELAKQQTINRDLVHFELEAKASESKLLQYMAKNKELKTESDKLLKKKNELESQLTSYQNTLKLMKQKTSRKIKDLHDDETEHHHHDTLRRTHSVTGIVGGSVHKGHRRGNSLTLSSKGRNITNDLGLLRNGKLGLGDPSSSYDSMDRVIGNDERMIIGQLHKQLDLNKLYNQLLEKTINSLRHRHNIYDLNKQWIQIKRDLKPLPSFNSMNDTEYKQYIQRKQHLKHREEMKKLQKKKRREKLLEKGGKNKKNKNKNNINDNKKNNNDDIDIDIDINRNLALSLTPSPKKRNNKNTLNDDVDDDDDDFDIDDDKKNKEDKENKKEQKDEILSSFEQKQIRKKRYNEIQKVLNNLNTEFVEIYSNPKIVDLAIKNKQNDITYNQNLIGRNLKLRDLKLKCVDLTKKCKDIESNFDKNNNMNKQEIDNENNTNSNLIPLGRIDIEGVKNNKNNNNNNKTKVCLNRNNVIKLQNYLNVLC